MWLETNDVTQELHHKLGHARYAGASAAVIIRLKQSECFAKTIFREEKSVFALEMKVFLIESGVMGITMRHAFS